jgi:hypothetical protein
MPREEWAFLMDPLTEAMRGFDFNGRKLDVRENVAFQGKGYQTRFVHERYPAARLRDRARVQEVLHGRVDGRFPTGEVGAMRRFVSFIAETCEDLLNERPGCLSLAGEEGELRFGPRGELRESSAERASAHGPLASVHRASSHRRPEESIGRRVAVNSPAYLIWSPDEMPRRKAHSTGFCWPAGEQVGKVLLIEAERPAVVPRREDSPQLPAIRSQDRRFGSKSARAALEALQKAAAT